MNQIFILGASTVYGVGGKHGGWADMLKLTLHNKMYGENGFGETTEVFNFGKAGASIDFVKKTLPVQFEDYSRTGTKVAIVNVGGNNAKAVGDSKNYVSTLEEFETQVNELLEMLKEKFSYVIFVGSGFYDEEKVSPKISPLDGEKSYFSNHRKKIFEAKCKEICEVKNITFVGLDNINQEKWIKKYAYQDGVHPNHYGYQIIHDKVIIKLENIFEELK